MIRTNSFKRFFWLAALALAGCGGGGRNPIPFTSEIPPGSYVGTWHDTQGDEQGTLSLAITADGHAYGTGTATDFQGTTPVSVYGTHGQGYSLILVGNRVISRSFERGEVRADVDGNVRGVYSQNAGDFTKRIEVDLTPGGSNVVPNPAPGTAIPTGHFVGLYQRDAMDEETLDLTVASDGHVTGTVTGDPRGTGAVTGTITANGAVNWTVSFPNETGHLQANIFTCFIDRLVGVAGEDNHVVIIDLRRQSNPLNSGKPQAASRK